MTIVLRALITEEFAKLLKAARTSKETIQCCDGVTRGMIYTLSFMTGLRRGEIASLTPNSFKLECTPATVTIEATNSKHRKLDVLPLHPELFQMLRDWMKVLGPDEHLFPKLARRGTWLMVKKDLEKAGIPYITPGNSTFVAPVFSRFDARAGGRFLPASTSCDCFLRKI